jgi:hypothetical protein
MAYRARWFRFLGMMIIGTTLLSVQAARAATLDTNKILAAYKNSEFELVPGYAEPFTKGKASFSRAESLFVYKYLGVVSAHNDKSKDNAMLFFHHMLQMDPCVTLENMVVSEKVERILGEARKKVAACELKSGAASGTAQVAGSGASSAALTPTEEEGKKAKRKPIDPVWYWVAGGAVVAGAGITAALVLMPEEKEGTTYVISGK